MNVPQDLLYSKEHEWVRVENGSAVVGITDYAQDQLGDVVYVELPEEGSSFGREESIASLESVKAVSDVYIPVSGQVVDVNAKLADEPETLNQDPYGEGWIVRVRLSDETELDDLMSADDYTNYLKEESEH